MKKLLQNKIVQIGVMAFCVIAASILLYFVLAHTSNIFKFLGKIINILMPLIYGLILAYIMSPIVHFFERTLFKNIRGVTCKRNLSILVTIVLIIGILAALICIIFPQLVASIQSLIVNVPGYLKSVENYIADWLQDADLEKTFTQNFGSVSDSITKVLNNVLLPLSNSALDKLSSGIFGFVTFIFNFVIGLIFSIYILANTKNFSAGLRKGLYSLFDMDRVNNFIERVKHINKIFINFMIGKICDSFGFVFTCTFIFLLVFRYPYALLIAIIIGLTDLIPYFGPYIGTIPSALLLCMVSPVKAITFVIFIIVLQQIDGNLVTPHIQKTSTGLPSFWVLFAITLFGGLFGVIGLLIAVPCFTIIYELCNEFVEAKLKKKNLPADSEFYHEINGLEKRVVKAKID